MQIKLVSKLSNDPNYALYLNAIRYFIKRLTGDKSVNIIRSIVVKLDMKIKDDGECYAIPLTDGSLRITIKINQGMNIFKTLLTIAHECVHAKQHIFNELYLDANDDWIWKGRNFGPSPYKGLTLDQIYIKLPWEKEALFAENGLIKEYLDYYIEGNS